MAASVASALSDWDPPVTPVCAFGRSPLQLLEEQQQQQQREEGRVRKLRRAQERAAEAEQQREQALAATAAGGLWVWPLLFDSTCRRRVAAAFRRVARRERVPWGWLTASPDRFAVHAALRAAVCAVVRDGAAAALPRPSAVAAEQRRAVHTIAKYFSAPCGQPSEALQPLLGDCRALAAALCPPGGGSAAERQCAVDEGLIALLAPGVPLDAARATAHRCLRDAHSPETAPCEQQEQRVLCAVAETACCWVATPSPGELAALLHVLRIAAADLTVAAEVASAIGAASSAGFGSQHLQQQIQLAADTAAAAAARSGQKAADVLKRWRGGADQAARPVTPTSPASPTEAARGAAATLHTGAAAGCFEAPPEGRRRSRSRSSARRSSSAGSPAASPLVAAAGALLRDLRQRQGQRPGHTPSQPSAGSGGTVPVAGDVSPSPSPPPPPSPLPPEAGADAADEGARAHPAPELRTPLALPRALQAALLHTPTHIRREMGFTQPHTPTAALLAHLRGEEQCFILLPPRAEQRPPSPAASAPVERRRLWPRSRNPYSHLGLLHSRSVRRQRRRAASVDLSAGHAQGALRLREKDCMPAPAHAGAFRPRAAQRVPPWCCPRRGPQVGPSIATTHGGLGPHAARGLLSALAAP
eukprot:TRINITY_DN3929_c0_g2_i1.p1 TRINITY_DN3929_c0_g2~~TRINITY_DN3929_c0_g2_i1.p1  ORF type:complete len:645 (+),score=125.01 TRINITY_DN3929_c0_g2_i1:61-1995(+)